MVQNSQTTTWDGAKNPVNNGIYYLYQLVSLPDFWTINSMKDADFQQQQHLPSQEFWTVRNLSKFQATSGARKRRDLRKAGKQ